MVFAVKKDQIVVEHHSAAVLLITNLGIFPVKLEF